MITSDYGTLSPQGASYVKHALQARQELYLRCFFRAGEVLRQGDRVQMIAHGSDRKVSYIFDRWDDNAEGFFISKSGVDELHPYNITAVNGEAISFRDPGPPRFLLTKDGKYLATRSGTYTIYWSKKIGSAMRFLTIADANAFAARFYTIPLEVVSYTPPWHQ